MRAWKDAGNNQVKVQKAVKRPVEVQMIVLEFAPVFVYVTKLSINSLDGINSQIFYLQQP